MTDVELQKECHWCGFCSSLQQRCQTATDDYSSIIVTYLTEQKSYLQHEAGRVGDDKRAAKVISFKFHLRLHCCAFRNPRHLWESAKRRREAAAERGRGTARVSYLNVIRGVAHGSLQWFPTAPAHPEELQASLQLGKKKKKFRQVESNLSGSPEAGRKASFVSAYLQTETKKTQKALIHQEPLVQQLLWNLVQPNALTWFSRNDKPVKD